MSCIHTVHSWATIKRFATEGMFIEFVTTPLSIHLCLHIGAKHIYALDLDNTNFNTLDAEFSTTFPNSKVGKAFNRTVLTLLISEPADLPSS